MSALTQKLVGLFFNFFRGERLFRLLFRRRAFPRRRSFRSFLGLASFAFDHLAFSPSIGARGRFLRRAGSAGFGSCRAATRWRRSGLRGGWSRGC